MKINYSKYLTIIAACILFFDFSYLLIQYILPILQNNFNGNIDFRYYFDAANQFFTDKMKVYDGNFLTNAPKYVYPPISILLFLPFVMLPFNFSFLAFVIINIAAYIISINILIKIIQKEYNLGVLSRKTLASIYLIGLSLAPFIQNIKGGQVNGILLLMVIISYYLFSREKIIFAVILLALSFWLKLYPIVLLPLFIQKGKLKEFFIGSGFGFVLLPLIQIPLFPLDLYKIYINDVLPKTSGIIAIGAFNQSLPALLMRIGLPVSIHSSWEFYTFPFAYKITSLIFGFLAFIFLLYQFYPKKNITRFEAFISVLALTCIITPMGWEFVYILALPLLLLLFIKYQGKSNNLELLVSLILIMFLIPKIPDGIITKMYVLPKFVILIFFSRFFWSVLISIFLVFNSHKKNNLLLHK